MIRLSLKLAIKECALKASEEKRLLVRRALSAIAALFFDCFGHFQPMFRKSKPVSFVERRIRQFGLLATFHGLLTALIGLGHELSGES